MHELIDEDYSKIVISYICMSNRIAITWIIRMLRKSAKCENSMIEVEHNTKLKAETTGFPKTNFRHY